MAPRGHSPVCKLATYNYHTSRLQLPLQRFERTLRGWIRMRHPADGFKRNFSRNWRGRGEERRRWWKRVRVVLTSFVSRGKMRKLEGERELGIEIGSPKRWFLSNEFQKNCRKLEDLTKFMRTFMYKISGELSRFARAIFLSNSIDFLRFY